MDNNRLSWRQCGLGPGVAGYRLSVGVTWALLRCEFEDDAVAGRAAEDSAAVQVAFAIDDEVAGGNAAVVAVSESVQNRVRPSAFETGSEFVDDAAPGHAAGRGGAI